MKQIEWQIKAIRQLRKIKDKKMQTKIFDEVSKLKNFPNCKNLKKIVNSNKYRLRVGNFRVLFTEDLAIIHIEEVKRRDEHTY